jgi:hypothetical protein
VFVVAAAAVVASAVVKLHLVCVSIVFSKALNSSKHAGTQL